MTDSSRRLAFDILKAVEADGGYSNILLNRKLERSKDADPALVRRLVHGVLKNQTLLDHQIARYLKKPNLRLQAKLLLRLGFYQLAFCEDMRDYTAVNETVALTKAVMRGNEGFINAVLRSFLRDGKELQFPAYDTDDADSLVRYLSVRYSCQEWIVRLWAGAYGADRAEWQLAESLDAPPLVLARNRLKVQNSYEFDTAGGITECEDYKQGRFSVVDSSVLDAMNEFHPQPGEKVLDLCAAPGGKTCLMAEYMENEGNILACDINGAKLRLVEKEAKRLGISIIKTCVRDAAAEPPEDEKNAYDAVLCDVPCSGLGVLRRKPEIKLRLKEEDAKALPELQSAILQNAGAFVKPGGRLMYSTCTVNPAENERVTDGFLQKSGFEKIKERQIFTGELSGAAKGDGFYYCLMRKIVL
jgi:16S rRNA (cytosine967-C5)-methyltransferase